MRRLMLGSISLLCGCAAWGVLEVSRAAADALAAWGAAPAALLAGAREESLQYRQAGLALASLSLAAADRRAGQALAVLEQTRQDLDTQLAGLRLDFQRQGDAVNRTAAGLRQDLTPVWGASAAALTQAGGALEEWHGLTAQFQQAAPLFLDCDHNPDCVFNRYVGLAQNWEQTSRAVSRAAPDTAAALREGSQAARDLAQSGAAIARSWEKQTPLYVRLIGALRSIFR